MRKTRLKSRPLRIEPTNHTSHMALLQLSYRRVSLFDANGKGKRDASPASFLPQKVLEAKTIESFASFVGAGSASSRKFLVNGGSRFPFCIRF